MNLSTLDLGCCDSIGCEVSLIVDRSIGFVLLRAMNGGKEVVVAAPPQPLDWRFSQVFGERTAGEEIQEGTSMYNLYILIPECVSSASLDPTCFILVY